MEELIRSEKLRLESLYFRIKDIMKKNAERRKIPHNYKAIVNDRVLSTLLRAAKLLDIDELTSELYELRKDR